ncbi:hypothetical protein FB567DRAFT_455962 [Paraphoma chrysanthemicola]|uniref:Uncharacterized protein n=1 Tax=Paraphoma chrysanthemicola TaxID=798071 RepID=A0A8K0QTJ6_9PLEO|nr:hypothetical protein FB567DRAFT_455962 [Paraphoma chrysanthemicola]
MPAPRPPHHASILFAPFELRMYQRWRSRYIFSDLPNNNAPLPTALEYAAYQDWRAQERKRCLPRNYINASDPVDVNSEHEAEEDYGEIDGAILATECKHPIHPAHASALAASPSLSSHIEDGEITDPPLYCPVCTLKAHQTLISAIYTKWTTLGAPWRDPPTTSPAEKAVYSATLRAYQKARVDLVNTISIFSHLADQESAWSLAHPESNTSYLQPYTATTAVQTYYDGITYPAKLVDPNYISLSLTTTPHPHSSKKKVTYSPTTPLTTRHRPSTLWTRTYPTHDPASPHACPHPEGWEDTSRYTDWKYVVAQCRILFCYPDPDDEGIYKKLKYDTLNPGPNGFESETTTTNSAVHRLITVLETWMTAQTHDVQVQWVRYLRDISDIFLVWKDAKDGDGFEDRVGGDGKDVFDGFQRVPRLVGSPVEAFARRVGDIDDEEWEGAMVERKSVEGKGSEVWGDEVEVGGQANEGGGDGQVVMTDESEDGDTSSSEDGDDVDVRMADPADLDEEDDDVYGDDAAVGEFV